MSDASRHRLLSAEDVSRLLPKLPPSLRSLNMGGARVNVTHIPGLRRLAKQVEELGLASADLSLSTDISRLFQTENNDSHKSAIRYLDLTDIKSVTQMSLSYSPDAITNAYTEALEVIEVSGSVLDELKRRTAKVKNPDWVVGELGRRGWYAHVPKGQTEAIDDGSRA